MEITIFKLGGPLEEEAEEEARVKDMMAPSNLRFINRLLEH